MVPPLFPNVPVLAAQLSQYTISFARSGFNIHALVPLTFEDAMRARLSGDLCMVAEVFGRTSEIGCTAVRITQADPRGLQERHLALCVHGRWSCIPNCVVNAILAELNGLQLLAPAALLGDLASMIDSSLAKAFVAESKHHLRFPLTCSMSTDRSYRSHLRSDVCST